jgi:hypothetical protein
MVPNVISDEKKNIVQGISLVIFWEMKFLHDLGREYLIQLHRPGNILLMVNVNEWRGVTLWKSSCLPCTKLCLWFLAQHVIIIITHNYNEQFILFHLTFTG